MQSNLRLVKALALPIGIVIAIQLGLANMAFAQDADEVNEAIIQEVLKTHHKMTGECEDNKTQSESVESFEIATSVRLIITTCNLAAYQSTSKIYLAKGDLSNLEISPQEFQYTTDGKIFHTLDQLTEPQWEEDSKILSTAHKGRGAGDCGSAAEHSWDGMKFILEEAAYLPCCITNEEDAKTEPECKGLTWSEDWSEIYDEFPVIYRRKK